MAIHLTEAEFVKLYNEVSDKIRNNVPYNDYAKDLKVLISNSYEYVCLKRGHTFSEILGAKCAACGQNIVLN